MRCTGLVIAITACGSDPAAPDATPQAIDVTVYAAPSDSGASSVYFVAPDGTTQQVAVDANGHASAVSPASSWVLVAHPQNEKVRVDAYGGIDPGMAITDQQPHTQTSTLQATVSFPAFAGASLYSVFSSCFGNGGSSDPSIALSATDCAQKTDANVVAVAQDGALHAIGYAWLQHADLTAPVALPALQPASTLTATFEHLPFAPQATGTAGQFFLQQGSDLSTLAAPQPTVTLGTDRATFTAATPPVGDHSRVQVHLSGAEASVDYARTLPGIAALTIDASTMPRLPHGRTIDGANVRWNEDAAGTTPVMVSILARSTAGSLYAYAPYTGTSLALPPFPAELNVSLDGAAFSLVSMDETFHQLVTDGFSTPPYVWSIAL